MNPAGFVGRALEALTAGGQLKGGDRLLGKQGAIVGRGGKDWCREVRVVSNRFFLPYWGIGRWRLRLESHGRPDTGFLSAG